MRLMVIAFVVASVAAGVTPALAADAGAGRIGTAIARAPSAGPITRAISRLEGQWAGEAERMASSAGQGQQAEERSWIGRHPVVFGALVGAGAGAVIGYSLGHDCSGRGTGSCSSRGGAALVGGAIFAGVGAVVGIVVDKAGN